MRPVRTLAFATAALLAAGSILAQTKPRVAVLEFENKASGSWYQLRANSQDMFVTELVKSGKYTVIDRERLNALMQEKNLSLAGDIDPKTAVKAGKLLGVEYFIAGAITEWGASDTHASAPSGLFGRLPSVSVNTQQFRAALDARAISATTGEIVWADSKSDTSSDARIFVAGAGGGSYDRGKADKVLRPIVGKLVADLNTKQLTTSGLGGKGDASGISGKIARVEGAEIYINVGAEAGVTVGQSFEVFRKGKVITDPDTGEVLGADEASVGKITVREVKGPRLSICTVASGKDFKVGDQLK
jgi:curli biogenesis system outer membrane secretion channel CsgG